MYMIHPTASMMYTTRTIPQEAVFVWEKMLDMLKKEDNLTLSFDGGST
jgi:cytochrome c-type biogenesis protein CcmH/NrfG